MQPTQTPDGTQLPNRSDEAGPELPSRNGEMPGPEMPPDPDVPPADTPHIVPSVPGAGGTDVPTSPEPGPHV